MLVVNFFGAPNSGKTTIAADVFAQLKKLHIEAEYVQEPVKIAHYTQNKALLNDELYLFAQKNHHLMLLKQSKVEVAVTDGPLLNSIIFAPEDYPNSFTELVCNMHEGYQNINIFMSELTNRFTSFGRTVNKSEAIDIGNKIHAMLDASGIEYLNTADVDAPEIAIMEYIERKIRELSDHNLLSIPKPLVDTIQLTAPKLVSTNKTNNDPVKRKRKP